jgi:hypothetical protein
MPIRTVLVALAFVQLAPGQSGQEKMKVIEQLVRTHVSWEPAANSGGLSVTLVETARNGDEFVYGLRATGTRRVHSISFINGPSRRAVQFCLWMGARSMKRALGFARANLTTAAMHNKAHRLWPSE